MEEVPAYPRIPYGESDFRRIRLNRWLYVDKTRLLHELEEVRYAFFFRPRGFGKSCWVSLLQNYYDRSAADRFESLFAGTDIARRPTPDRHRYVILHFDLSALGDAGETSQEHFEQHCSLVLRLALERNRDLFPDTTTQRILAAPSIGAKMNELFLHMRTHYVPLYVLVDGYDYLANTVLASRGAGTSRRSVSNDASFYRSFFSVLKAGAGHGAIERMFVTGVAPISMAGVTGGFNIGTDISMHPEFAELLGFTEAEVRGLLERYRDLGVFDQDVDEAMTILDEWYRGYRFARDAPNDLYHTNLVLRYLAESIPNAGPPDDLIDRNVRTDYGKLFHLLTVSRQLGDTFALLRQQACEGEGTVYAAVSDGFLLEDLPTPGSTDRGRAGEHWSGSSRPIATRSCRGHWSGILTCEATHVRLPARRLPGRGSVQRRPYRFEQLMVQMEPGRVAAGAATAQLQRYLAEERLARRFPDVRFVGMAVVFHGWELAYCDAVA